jgi:hypothetical protein
MEYIKPIIDKVLAVLEARTPALLDAVPLERFQAFGRLFTGVEENFPALEVMPVRTEFDPECQGYEHEAHQVQIKLAIMGAEPDQVTDAAMAYVKAVTAALAASWPGDWADLISGGQIQRLFVRAHDYGPLFAREAVLARWPVIDLIIEAVET